METPPEANAWIRPCNTAFLFNVPLPSIPVCVLISYVNLTPDFVTRFISFGYFLFDHARHMRSHDFTMEGVHVMGPGREVRGLDVPQWGTGAKRP